MMPIFASERGTICLWKYAYGVEMVEEPQSGQLRFADYRARLSTRASSLRRGMLYSSLSPQTRSATSRSEMDVGLRDKVAVITGGSRGIGRAIGLGLAAEGCNVAFCARGEESLRETESALRKLGARALGVPVDVTQAGATGAVGR